MLDGTDRLRTLRRFFLKALVNQLAQVTGNIGPELSD